MEIIPLFVIALFIILPKPRKCVELKALSIDATFRKMTNRNQTDTNEIAITETKYQTDLYFAEKYQYLTKF